MKHHLFKLVLVSMLAAAHARQTEVRPAAPAASAETKAPDVKSEAAALSAAPAQTALQAPSQATSPAQAQASPVPSAAQSTASRADTTTERFRPGQAMTLEVPLDTATHLTGGYPIDSSGFVDLPILGKLYIIDKTREEVEAYVSDKLSNYIRDTHVIVKPCIRVTMLGYWFRPGQFYISPNTTVWDAVLRAGGMGGERTIDEIEIRRGSHSTSINFLDAYSGELTLARAGIHSGDIIIIPTPRDNTGFWYWFKESISVTAQLATVLTGALSAYVTYTLIDSGKLYK